MCHVISLSLQSDTEDVALIKEENRRLKENMERATAHWEGKVRRLEMKLRGEGKVKDAKSSVSGGCG